MSWLSVDPIDVGETGGCIILSTAFESFSVLISCCDDMKAPIPTLLIGKTSGTIFNGFQLLMRNEFYHHQPSQQIDWLVVYLWHRYQEQ